MSPYKCLLCGNELESRETTPPNSDSYKANCKTCGEYYAGGLFDATIDRELLVIDKAMISAYTRELYELKTQPPNLETLSSADQLDNIIDRYKRKTIIEKLNNLIYFIGKQSEFFGKPIIFHDESNYPITYSVDKRECENIRELGSVQ